MLSADKKLIYSFHYFYFRKKDLRTRHSQKYSFCAIFNEKKYGRVKKFFIIAALINAFLNKSPSTQMISLTFQFHCLKILVFIYDQRVIPAAKAMV